MIRIEISNSNETTQFSPDRSTLRQTVVGNSCQFVCPDATESIPVRVARLTTPLGNVETWPPGSKVVIDGQSVTISQFADGPGLYTYRVDLGAEWAILELTVN